ncbi:hypothetical protein [Nonomuraea sp. NPDC049684]|uniref:hypothetical protein n=1 Tax=Nonomuraea sp. NPDC049684 TaxID=3364356 RepID=UPI0037B11586
MGRHRARTGLGREFRAADVVATRGGDGAHVVLEAVGDMPAYRRALRPGGVISRAGVPQHDDAPIGTGGPFRHHLRLAGGPAPVRAHIDAGTPPAGVAAYKREEGNNPVRNDPQPATPPRPRLPRARSPYCRRRTVKSPLVA